MQSSAMPSCMLWLRPLDSPSVTTSHSSHHHHQSHSKCVPHTAKRPATHTHRSHHSEQHCFHTDQHNFFPRRCKGNAVTCPKIALFCQDLRHISCLFALIATISAITLLRGLMAMKPSATQSAITTSLISAHERNFNHQPLNSASPRNSQIRTQKPLEFFR